MVFSNGFELDRVSVVIPTYNSSSFIAETLDTIVNQTHPVSEIIIADDCSTDDTLEQIEQYASSTAIAIRILRGDNNSGGPAAPINQGVRAARSEFVTIMDHDDQMEPEKVELQLRALNENPDCGLALCDYRHFDGQLDKPDSSAAELFSVGHTALQVESEIQRVSISDATAAFIKTPGLPRSSSGQFFRKDHFERLGGYRPRMGPTSDFDFAMRSLNRDIVWVAKSLYRKRVHAGNLWLETPKTIANNLKIQWSAVHNAGFEPFDPITCIVRRRNQDFLDQLRGNGWSTLRVIQLMEFLRQDVFPRAVGRLRRMLFGHAAHPSRSREEVCHR